MVLLDKYYTRKEVVVKCLESLESLESFQPSAVIEPSAGNGTFLKTFQEKPLNSTQIPIIGYDIQPDDPSILCSDFLKLQPEEFIKYGSSVLCLGNPPFGRQNNLAIKFFNHCANIPNVFCIAMIFPKSFRKESVQKRLNLWFHLEKEFDLERNSFESADQTEIFDIPCIFQIWFRKDTERIQPQIEQLHPSNLESFNFIPKTDIKNNDYVLSLRRVGFYAGRAKIFEDENKESHYFIRCKTLKIRENLLKYLNSITWNLEDTVGPRSISKQQFIRKINLEIF